MKKTIQITIILLISFILLSQNVVIFAASKTELQSQGSALNEKIDEAKENLDKLGVLQSQTLTSIQNLTSQISNFEAEISELQGKISNLNVEISTAEKGIAEKIEEYNSQEELLKERLTIMYENGKTSYLDVLLSSNSFTSFLSKYYMVAELAESDTEFLKAINEQKKTIENQKAKLETDKSELANSKTTLEAKKAQVQTAKKEKQTYMNKLSAEEKEIQAELDKFEADKKAIDAELKKIAAEEEAARRAAAAANGGTTTVLKPSQSGFIRPVTGYNITCGFYGYSGHGGVDFSGSGMYSKPVLAVKAGTVVTSTAITGSIKNYDANGKYLGSYSSYGEYIIISHGDGLYTLYAHGLSGSRKVKVGDTVKQGQQIMSVGNTGNVMSNGVRPSQSNPLLGTHLHFEVRTYSNGVLTRVNPTPYLP